MKKRDLTKIFVDEIYSKPPRKTYPTNKIVYNSIDEIWSIDLADFLEYKTSNNKGFRYILVIIDNFSKHLWAIPLKNNYSQTITQDFSNFLTESIQKPLKIESERGKNWYNSIFQNLLKSKNLYHFSRYTDKGASVCERVIRTIRNLLKKPIFLAVNADWKSELPSVIKQYNNTIHSSIKMTTIQASKESTEKLDYSNLQDKREKRTPNFLLGDLVRTSDTKKVFSKGDSTNYSYKLYTITEVMHNTIPSYRINYLPERYNENLLLPNKLSLDENNQVMKKLNVIQ